MAHLFTVPFQYKEQTYTAVVSFTNCNGKSTTTIHIPDESLHPILQGSTIRFDAEKGLPIDYPTLTPAQDLLVSILAAIAEHDQKFPISINKNH